MEWDDPEFIALRRYGAEIVDVTGKLKNFQELTEEVYQAWKKADAEGNGIEFLQLTGGESGIRDAIQYFKRYEEAKEDAEKIFDAGLDPEELHDADRALNLLTEQIDEFKDAAANILTPASVELARRFFLVFHEGTKFLSENKDAIQDWGKTFSEFIFNPLGVNPVFKNPLERIFTPDQLKKWEETYEKRRELADALQKEQEKAKNSNDLDPLSQYGLKRAMDIKDAIADLKVEIQYENEYQKAVAAANLERERASRQLYLSASERAAINEQYNARIEQAEKEHSDKLESLWDETAKIQFDSSHSAFQSQIRDIEEWKNKALDDLGDFKDAVGDKNKWLQESAAITANALAKEAKAYEEEMDRITGKNKTLTEKIFEQTHFKEDIEIKDIQKQAHQYLDEGADYDLVKTWFNNEFKNRNIRKPSVDFWKEIEQQAKAFTESRYLQIDETKFNNLMDKLKNAGKSKSPSLSVDTPKVESNLQNQIQAAVQSQIDFKPINDKLNQSLSVSTSYFESSLLTAANAATNFSNSLADSVQKLSSLDTNAPITPQTPNLNFDFPKFPEPKLNFQSPTDNPNVFDTTELTAEIKKIITTEEKYFPDIVSSLVPLDKISTEIASLTQTLGSIAQDNSKNQSQPINISVSPNINVNLGGAYVFDNAMKNKLTDDITTEVANAVTSAVRQGVNELRQSYGN